jgi:shikimate kinase
MPNHTPPVVLIGPPASGKTKIGKRVARLLGVPHIDTDQVVVESHGPIPELFATLGEQRFRELERQAVGEALTSHAVVSLGGGAVTHPDTRTDLRHHTVIGLTISEEAVSHRLNNDKRPLLKNGVSDWVALVEKRTPLYDEVTTWSVDVSHRSADDVAEEIVSWLGTKDPTS